MIPDNIERAYFSISEASKALGVPSTTIRYWETYFNIVIRRGRKGRRKYTIDEIGRFALIARLAKWFKRKHIKELLRDGRADKVLEVLEPNVSEPILEGTPMKIVA